MEKYTRWQASIVLNALKTRRVILIAGARQCGKTTLSKSVMTEGSVYRTLDDKLLLQAAKIDPQTFLKKSGEQHHLMIIDEVQKAIELIPAIKMMVDENTDPGQFLLTGSADIQSLPGVTESLAGRIRKVPLRPLSQGEIQGNAPCFLEDSFDQKWCAPAKEWPRDEIIRIALRGGYPEPLYFESYERILWHQDYIDALLERDLKDILNIRRQEALENLMKVVAAWSTKPIDISAIGSSLSLQRQTLESYLNAFESLYLIDRIPAYAETDYARVGKQPKLIMNDSGLMASILRFQLKDIRFDGDRVGKLIETHVGNELQKHVDATEGRYGLFYYRDKDKREIDYLIAGPQGDLLGIEVKSSTSLNASDFKHLEWFQENLVPENKKFIGIVLYAGAQVLSMGENLWAVPIPCLYG
jgi:predicted AAA+ superfamily ATPase